MKQLRSEERKPNRLKDYDYSRNGFYFVTICTKDREESFGKIENDAMVLNKFGEIAEKCWKEIPEHFKNVELDEFIVMPNHIHGIIVINPVVVGNRHACSLQQHTCSLQAYSPQKKRNIQKLPTVIGSFKSSVTQKINKIQNEFCFQWQKSYYDHIIRNEKSLEKIRKYIYYNSLKWELDKNQPTNLSQ